MAIFDGQTSVDLFNYEANSVNDGYWQFEGLVWCHNPDGNVYFDHITHVKFLRCGAYDCGDGNNINFAGGNSASYCLFENCYGFGSGRYKFMYYLADHCIIRSCVGRGDRMNAVEPMANFAIYSCNYCEVQNCIAIDTDQTSHYSADEYDGGFLVPATNVSASYINFINCINLNNTWVPSIRTRTPCLIMSPSPTVCSGRTRSPKTHLALAASREQAPVSQTALLGT